MSSGIDITMTVASMILIMIYSVMLPRRVDRVGILGASACGRLGRWRMPAAGETISYCMGCSGTGSYRLLGCTSVVMPARGYLF